ncbi:MAG: VCBS repeat-containing protein [Desulfobacterales bacterium]|nr:VCBS repeat-containing protein [Desulfobacterales bacterium]
MAAVSLSTGRWWSRTSPRTRMSSWGQHEVGTFAGARSVAPSDINDDGKLDIVVGSGSGSGSLLAQLGQRYKLDDEHGRRNGPGLRSIEAADMDGDASPDIIVACRDANRIYWFKNFIKLSQPWVRYDVSTYFAGARGVSTGDLNGDNVPDVIGCAETGKISWWRPADSTRPPSSLPRYLM